jgi:hypothetical protein
LSGNASGGAKADSEHPSYGLGFHFDFDGNSAVGSAGRRRKPKPQVAQNRRWK